ncbi:ABC transporter permease [Piscinibacter sp.]|uniref:ABC transporter permease n=1 Tax=Piscinibacter sp. TaxID=1903157 RepID=UPI0039E25F6C
MGAVLRLLRGAPAYLWSGWGALASLMLLLAAWEAAAQALGPLVLPTPAQTWQALHALAAERQLAPALLATGRRALLGLGAAMALGTVLGMLAGRWAALAVALRPLVTVVLGTPPIAWLVLALLWFGAGDGTPVFTVFIACFPPVFAAALQGTRTLDRQLRDMARAFRLPPWMALREVLAPHVLSYVFPAWITALGQAWKVVVMAELLATESGVGAALAVTRSQLDTAGTLAWVAVVVGCLLALESLLLVPIQRELERWREATT